MGPIIGSTLWGPQWFYNELLPPSGPPRYDIEANALMATTQLVISSWDLMFCWIVSSERRLLPVAYSTMFVWSVLGYITIKDSLAHDFALQEKFTGVILAPLMLGDVSYLPGFSLLISSIHPFNRLYSMKENLCQIFWSNNSMFIVH